MPDQPFREEIQPKPPQGSEKKASEYITQLVGLINQDKLIVSHTDLSKHDPSNLQDHYRIQLKEYMVEVSHSKDATSGRDSFVLLFTNVKNIRDGCNEKLILGYLHLNSDQFNQFRLSSKAQVIRIKKQEEEATFSQNLKPIDEVLSQLASGQFDTNPSPSVPEVQSPLSSNQQITPEENQPTLSSIAESNPRPAFSDQEVEQSQTNEPFTPASTNITSTSTPPAYS